MLTTRPVRASAAVLFVSLAAAAQSAPAASGFDSKLTPFIAPAYAPELGFLLNVGGILSFSADPRSPAVPRSSLTLVGAWGTAGVGSGGSGAWLVLSRLFWFMGGDSVRLFCDFNLRDMPDQYFGVGYRKGHDTPQSPETTGYRRSWLQTNPTLLIRVAGPLYVGPVFEVAWTSARNEAPLMQSDPYFVRDGPRVTALSMGLTAQFDTRDVASDPHRGVYAAVTFLASRRLDVADQQYQSFTLDYRQYVTLFRPGSTLAWQLHWRSAIGPVPWPEMSLAGTAFDLRAYREGQYRAPSAGAAVLEYRLMLPGDPDGLLHRFGVVAWVGAGTLGNNPLALEGVLPSVGVGIRFAAQPRINIRLDFGVGDGSRAFYFQFLEAF